MEVQLVHSNVTAVLSGVHYPVLMEILQYLNQSDIEAFLAVFPNVACMIRNVEAEKFPNINCLQFKSSTSHPIPVKRMYKKIYLTNNLSVEHPSSKAILENVDYLSEIVFGDIDICKLKGSILEKIVQSDVTVQKIVIEHYGFCCFDVFGNHLIRNGAVHIREFEIKRPWSNLNREWPLSNRRAIAQLVRSMRVVETLYLPLSCLRCPLLFSSLQYQTSSVVHTYSLLNASFTPATYEKLFKFAYDKNHAFVDVKFEATNKLTPEQCEQYFGRSIQGLTGLAIKLGVSPELRAQVSLRLADEVHIRMGETGFNLDIWMYPQHYPRRQRSIRITSLDDSFSGKGLSTNSLMQQSLALIFTAFGPFEILNIKQCPWTFGSAESTLRRLYGNIFRELIY